MIYHGFKFAQNNIEKALTALYPILQCNREPTIVFGPLSSIGTKDGKVYANPDKTYTKNIDDAIAEYEQSLPTNGGYFDSNPLLKVISLMQENKFYDGKNGVYIPSFDIIALEPSISIPLIPYIHQLSIIPTETIQGLDLYYKRVLTHELVHWAMAQSTPFEELRTDCKKKNNTITFEGKKIEEVLLDSEIHSEKIGKIKGMEKMKELGIMHFLEHAGHVFEQFMFTENSKIIPINVKEPKDVKMYLLLTSLLNQYGLQGYVQACRQGINLSWEKNIPLI